jgi:hypothetical protein
MAEDSPLQRKFFKNVRTDFKAPDVPAEVKKPAPVASPQPISDQSSALERRAESAKERYMRENNVDENGDLIKKR